MKKIIAPSNDFSEFSIEDIEQSIPSRFENQVKKYPTQTAVKTKDNQASYETLNSLANRIARAILAQSQKDENVIALLMEQGIPLIAGILAVLKTGKIYVPLNPSYPQERNAYILNDSGAGLIVTNTRNMTLAGNLGGNLAGSIRLLNVDEIAGTGDSSNLELAISPGTPACILYTSGSTGQPKGVLDNHRNVLHNMMIYTNGLHISHEDHMTIFHSCSFGASRLDMYGALLNGAVLHLRDMEEEGFSGMAGWLAREKITLYHSTPTVFRHFISTLSGTGTGSETFPDMRIVHLGSEPVQLNDIALYKKHFHPGCLFLNRFGTTETGTVRLFFSDHETQFEGSTTPAGYAVHGMDILIRDETGQEVKPGEVGEIAIKSRYLSQGYWQKPDLTKAVFLDDPANNGERIYKTGDLGRILPDGCLIILGRKDSQVKIKGFRVEIPEIETALLKLNLFREAVVVPLKDPFENSYLAAYLVPLSETALNVSRLRDELKKTLPEYMVPSAFVSLKALPRTPNDKIDRKALPEPGKIRPELGVDYTAAQGDLEQLIVSTWQEVLHMGGIGTHDNFFDLGGTSLLMNMVHSKLQKVLGIAISLIDMYGYPTINSLANYIKSLKINNQTTESNTIINSEDKERPFSTGIAIIGMAGRFPGAVNVEQYWQNLCNGVESITFFTDPELEANGISQAILADPTYVKASGILPGAEFFDASFFGYTPREAELMDPQQRIFLELAWQALEDAGCDPGTYPEAIGVFAGANWNTYKIKNVLADPEFLETVSDYQVLLGNDKDYITTRVSYKLDLKGPSINIQTACSSSLVAVHQACRSLQLGECSVALAGGFSVRVPQKTGYFFREGALWSADGHCKAFDAEASGVIFSSGGGIVVLKRLSDALQDRDMIHAVIRGSAVNNDGSVKVGFTAPSLEGQRDVVEKALANANIEPDDMTYIEAHGTGTPIGDPIEINALIQAFRKKTNQKKFCAVGSVKTNIGHVGAASGVAGLIKTTLSLKHKLIPPTLHYRNPNPNIDFENSPFYVNTELNTWKTNNNKYYAGVSSFGIGGTNVHVILEEAPPAQPSSPGRPSQLFLISAKTDTALDRNTQNLASYLEKNPGINLADFAYTLQTGRKSFPYRRMAVCANREQAVKDLSAPGDEGLPTHLLTGDKPSLVFMFSGQGAQYINMGLELYNEEPLFREEMDRGFHILESLHNINVKDILYPSPGLITAAEEKINDMRYTGPIKLLLEYSLSKLLMKWGLTPQAMIGHSFGEYTAACLAGVFSLEDALKLSVHRGHLMHKMPEGAMMSISITEKELLPLLDNDLYIATVNSPSLCVVSGLPECVTRLEKKLKAQGYECLRLNVYVAAHSPIMLPFKDEFTEFFNDIHFNKPQIPYISGLTGDWITAENAVSPLYWSRHMTETIRFADGITRLIKEISPVFVQIGPDRGLSLFVNQNPHIKEKNLVINMFRHKKETGTDIAYLLNGIGQLWLAGFTIDWQAFYAHEIRNRIQFPGYSFEPQPFWISPQKKSPAEAITPYASTAKKANISEWFYIPSWKRSLPPQLLIKKESKQKGLRLIFSDKDGYGIGTKISEGLENSGYPVITVTAGDTFTRIDDRSFTINNKQYDDYDKLFRELRETGKNPGMIIHLWTLTPDVDALLENPQDDDIQDRGFHSLLFTAQALGNYFADTPIHLSVVSNNAVEWSGKETVFPGKATVLGPCKVIPQEYTNITCNFIDIEVPCRGREKDPWLETLLNEFELQTPDPVIAYREHNRWIQTYEPVLWENKNHCPALLRKEGVYLIVGGMGGIGLVLSEYLAKRVQAKIVLTARSVFPSREEWEHRLNLYGPKDTINIKIQKIKDIEKLGSRVLVIQADALDLQAMQEVMKKTHEQFGQLNGIIYAAGAVGGGMIQFKTKESAAGVLAPKVKGMAILSKIIREEKLDFLALCSSLASIWGGVGRVDYCAANAFLDAFAYYNNTKNNILTISINWDIWQEVGMGFDAFIPSNLNNQREESLKNGILSSEGMTVFERILHAGVPQILVSTRDLQHRIIERKNELIAPGKLELTPVAAPSKRLNPRPKLANTYAAPGNEFEKSIAATWQKIFGIDKVGVHDDFFQLGGHSLLATQLLNRLQKDFSFAELSLRDLFDNPTIAKTAELIEKAHNRKTGKKEQTVKESFLSLFPLDRPAFMENYLKEKFAKAFAVTIDQFPTDGDLKTFDLESVTTNLIWDIKRDFQLPLYPHEILKRPYIKDLARFIADEFEYVVGIKNRNLELSGPIIDQIFRDELEKSAEKPKAPTPVEKNKSMVFILSAPRAGSTLLRLMMAGHPALFCPPELGLLMYRSINKWTQNRLLPFSREGIVIALMELLNIDAVKCKTLVEEMKQKDMSIKEVYRIIQEALGDRILVDKTPRYSMIAETLAHAEEIFMEPKYVHLVRHPYPVIESFVRNRFEKIFTAEDVDSYMLAERIWTSFNQNILEFSKKIDKTRYHLLPYEDLVRDPKATMEKLCEFIGIPFDEALILPYDGKKRMIDGPGDPNIFQHDKIEANLGDVWKNISLPRPPAEETRHIAAYFDYNLPAETISKQDNNENVAIKKVPISYAQRKYWNFDQKDKGNPTYNTINAYRITGPFDTRILELTINEIAGRHEPLRSVFRFVNSEPTQIVYNHINLKIFQDDLRELPTAQKEKELERIIRETALYRFDLDQGPLLHLKVIRLEPEEYVLIRCMSHICSDGWSLSVLRKELGILYSAFAEGKPSPLPEPLTTYSAYSSWLENWVRGESARAHLDYWKQKLAGPLPVLNLPTDYPRPAVSAYEAGRHSIILNRSLYDALIDLSTREKCTFYIVMLAAFNVLLRAYSGQEDIIVGTPVSGRRRTELESLIGCFADFVAVRVNLHGEPTFLELLNRVKNECMEAFQHQDLPFEKVREELFSSSSDEPIYRVILNMLNYEDMQPDFPGLTVNRIEVDKQRVETDLKILLIKKQNDLMLVLYYDSGLFSASTMANFLDNYRNLLEQITANPEQKISAMIVNGL